jgi:hypothetical protein
VLEGENSIAGKYSIDWEGCESKAQWFLGKFMEAASRDGLQQLPVMSREGAGWPSALKKGDNSLRVVLHEKTADGAIVSSPEDPGLPPVILYGPRAEIKLRRAGMDVAEVYLQGLYSGKTTITGQLSSKEWAMIGTIGDGKSSGTIPDCYRAIVSETLAGRERAWNQRIADAGRRT